MNTSALKNLLRSLLGENITSQIHGFWNLYLIKNKPLPDPEVDYLKSMDLHGTLSIDVGANGANWTKALSDLVGPSGAVIAFEAHPYYYKSTRAAVSYDKSMSKNSVIYPTALSDTETSLKLLTKENGQYLDGQSRIIDDTERSLINGVISDVDAIKLDAFLAKEGLDSTKISVIKLDVEGHEAHVVRGGLKSIERWRPVIVCEINKGDSGELCHIEIRKMLENLGYRLFITDGNSLDEFTELSQLDSHISRNIICIYIKGKKN
jgi:FkbM family methyltransferase